MVDYLLAILQLFFWGLIVSTIINFALLITLVIVISKEN